MRYLFKITILTIFITALCLLVSCAEKSTTTDTQSLMLNGAVHSIDEEFYYASYLFDKLILNEKLYNRHYSFDTNERYTQFIHTNVFLSQQGSKILTDTAVIDSGILIKDTLLTNDSTKWAKPSNFGDGRETFIDPDYIRKDYRYINDSVYLISSFDQQGNLLFYEDCRMSNSKLNAVRAYSNDDKLISKTNYYYDKKERLVSKIKYYEKTSYQFKYRYNLGKKYESDSYTAKHYVFSYNNSGFLKKQKIYIGDAHVSTNHYKYDDMYNVISIREVNKITGEEKESVFTYIYDKQNNWIEQIEKRYDGNIFVCTRKINYY